MEVHSWSGVEAISRVYDFRIDVSTPLPGLLFERYVLGSPATFHASVAGQDRHVHGIICAVRAQSRHVAHAPEHAHFTLRLVPRLWLFSRRRDSRIFQDKRFDEVLHDVFHARNLESKWHMETERPKRPYLTQYEESDLAFVRRLCAENATLFYFEQPAGRVDTAADLAQRGLEALGDPRTRSIVEIVALLGQLGSGIESPSEEIHFTDHAAYPAIESGGLEGAAVALGDLATHGEFGHAAPAPVIRYLHGGALSAAEENILDFSLGHSIRTTSTSYHVFDPRRPMSPLRTSAHEGALTESDLGDVLRDAMTGGSAGALSHLDFSSRVGDLERYDHDERDLYPDWDYGHKEAERALLQHRRDHVNSRGRSSSVRLSAGKRFTLLGHHHLGVDGVYVVTAVRHEGTAHPATSSETPYTNRFECVPANVAYLPKRPRRRSVQVCLTATVAGPPGDDIYVNDHGQIKVKFHWDRAAGDADPTCWLRTMQAWAGAGWGAQFIPRVGMEVVVGFDGGDPDKPIVLGAVYNGTHPMPFATPRHKTRSGFRSRSSPRGDGNNELSFEDKAGEEQIYIHAERDFDTHVRHDRTARIGNDEHLEVRGQRTATVRGREQTTIGGAEERTVTGDRTDRVQGTEYVRREDLDVLVMGTRHTVVNRTDRAEVRGDELSTVHGDHVRDIRGASTVLVGRADEKRAATALVEGPLQVTAAESIDITSDKDITFRVGCSFIRLTSGKIELGSSEVSVNGEDARLLLKEGEAKLKVNNKFQVVSDDSIVMKSTAASLGLKSEAKLDGTKVLLNSPENASDDIQTNQPNPTRIELVDEEGQPVAYQRYRIELGDGTEYTGFLDEEGKAEVDLPSSGTITFPELADVQSG